MAADGKPASAPATYDELGMFHENAAEAGLPWRGPPSVERVDFPAPSGHRLSGLRWGDGPPEIVLIHGGAQNAHTWDTVALALDRPLLAVDLPGHGHSEWRDDKRYRPQEMAGDVGAMIEALAGEVRLLAGMSLGGLTATVVTAERPALVGHLALVDITPGVNNEKAKEIIDFVSGPEMFTSFDEILERTILFNPTRSESSLRRGVLHNAKALDDGRWTWRYDLPSLERVADLEHRFTDLWEAIDAVSCPLTLFQGSRSPVVDDADVAELLRRQPAARHVVVDDAGHSIQGDQPVRLAELLAEILDA
jgi:pimeloyl-ACP methyl ester carboxylesterase